MTKQAIIERTIKAINQLPEDRATEVSDFADLVAKRYEEELLAQGIKSLTEDAQAFCFLRNEEDLYTEADLKEVYRG